MKVEPLVLEGSRLRLEPLLREHLSALCQVGLDAALWKDTTIRVQTPDEMRDYIETALQWQTEGTALPFVVVENTSDSIIGTTRYHHIVPEHRRLEIGFTWIATKWQGMGLNTEAKLLMLTHAFEQWQCGRVEFKADSENTASCRALESIGAKEEGTLRSYVVSAHKGVRDLVLYSIISSEWSAVKAHLIRKIEGISEQ